MSKTLEDQKTKKLFDKSLLAVYKCNYSLSTKYFKKALKANGDPACFFFGDIVRILVKNKDVSFEMDNLYTDVNITDNAKKQLLELNDDIIISAMEIYYKNHSGNKISEKN